MNETTFPKPVFAGDTIRARTTVVELRDSKSRPTQGIVTFEHLGLNRKDEIVCRTLRGALMMRSPRSEEHTSELQSLMSTSYAVFCLKKKTNTIKSTLAKN